MQKEKLKKFSKGLLSLTLTILLSVGITSGLVFAWSGLTAQDGDTLTAAKWNELVTLVNTKADAGTSSGGFSSTCTTSTPGVFNYDSVQETMNVCLGGDWKEIASNSKLGEQDLPGLSCKYILDNGGSIGDGKYWINSGGEVNNVYCDMVNGGWTLIFSSQTVPALADKGGAYNSKLSTITPNGSMLSVWTPFEAVSNIKFTCDGGKDGTIDYTGYDNSNVIYSEIKNCTNGLCQGTIAMTSGENYGSSNDGTSDSPDFWIPTDNSWGTYDDRPYNTPSDDDLCAGTGYRSTTTYPTETTIGGAYFYIWVK